MFAGLRSEAYNVWLTNLSRPWFHNFGRFILPFVFGLVILSSSSRLCHYSILEQGLPNSSSIWLTQSSPFLGEITKQSIGYFFGKPWLLAYSNSLNSVDENFWMIDFYKKCLMKPFQYDKPYVEFDILYAKSDWSVHSIWPKILRPLTNQLSLPNSFKPLSKILKTFTNLFHSSLFIVDNRIIAYYNSIINFLESYVHFRYSKIMETSVFSKLIYY